MVHFWAKTTQEGKPGISVFDHMVNVGCVARRIAEMWPEVLEYFQLRSQEIGVLVALHDLGKISPGFQRKSEAWLEEYGLMKVARNGCWDTAMESDHGKVSHSAIQEFLLEQGISRNQAQYLSAILGAHHGRIKFFPNPRGILPPHIKQTTEGNSRIEWNEERQKNAQQTWRYFEADSSFITITGDSPALWWLAGLASVADWIGSDERYFPPGRGPDPGDPSVLALEALSAIGFRPIQLVHNLSFHDLFHDSQRPEIEWVPNEMQKKTVATVTGPGVYVVEAPMGMGKTEAALWAAYSLLLSRKATGIYFALPTQMTSNRIHLRMNEFLQRISLEASSRLIHGNSWLFQSDCPIHPAVTERREAAPEDARAGRDWFTSTKRALLAPFGVGTVDQALLGVVAAKHFFVRHFALAGKVVILDEIHSYDLYTGTLIDTLISTLEGLGCTVIVLSATLTGKRRGQIVSGPDDALDDELPYPLITGRNEGIPLEPVSAPTPKSREVRVEFASAEKARDDAVALARKGGAVLWICNTVDAAQVQYQQLIDQIQLEFPIGLLHSRFPFWRREELETEWMARFGKDGKTRCGSILVSTQVVEQSVDLDADLLITELAPSDMLLQRLGRLWRHEREHRLVDEARLCILEEVKSLDELRRMEPKAIVEALGGKAQVYAPFVLLRSLELWEQQSQKERGVSIPADIRRLLELTYQERDDEPDSWQQLFYDLEGNNVAIRTKALQSSNIWLVALEDEEGVQTRLNEVPTAALVLCREITAQEAFFVDQSKGVLGNGEYRFATTQAIHKNLVKVPEHCFTRIEPCPSFSDYLYGKQCLGIVAEDGTVEVHGLQKGIRLFYSDDLGLVIEKRSTWEEI